MSKTQQNYSRTITQVKPVKFNQQVLSVINSGWRKQKKKKGKKHPGRQLETNPIGALAHSQSAFR
jgi:hypothetical protein